MRRRNINTSDCSLCYIATTATTRLVRPGPKADDRLYDNHSF